MAAAITVGTRACAVRVATERRSTCGVTCPSPDCVAARVTPRLAIRSRPSGRPVSDVKTKSDSAPSPCHSLPRSTVESSAVLARTRLFVEAVLFVRHRFSLDLGEARLVRGGRSGQAPPFAITTPKRWCYKSEISAGQAFACWLVGCCVGVRR